MKIGYVIPEFPGQTHIFFWREIQVLRSAGLSLDLISTRPPAAGIVSHSWSREAIAQTEYLSRFGGKRALQTALELLRAGPVAWLRCAASIGRAQGLSAKERLLLPGYVLLGARLAALARERGWSHVHIHSCANSAHIGLFAHLLSGLSYSITLHGPLSDYGPNQREKWRFARFAFVITRRLLREVGIALAGALPPRIEIAPMGVDEEKLRRGTPYQGWTGEGPLRIFSCGRLSPCKGHADLIDAVMLLRGRGIDARLAIAGEDESGGAGYHTVLAAKIAELGAGGVVELLGAVDEGRVVAEIERAHLFSLASLAEPLGVAIMEAMSLEAPVVVTGAGGVPELVDDGADGLLVSPGQPAELAQRLEAVARDPALARRLGAAGRLKVERDFSSKRSARLLAGLLGCSPEPIRQAG